MTDRVGQHVGNYRIMRLLGRGGFADVYLGEHIHLQSLAALKLLHTQLSGEETARFLTEARTLTEFFHQFDLHRLRPTCTLGNIIKGDIFHTPPS